MIFQALAFYLFAAIMVASAVLVVSARNPVHSVLFLILAFFNAAALFVLIGAEFLAMILVVVYVGAVAVLFLFVVMMLDIDFAALRKGFAVYLPIGATVGLILLVELVLVLGAWTIGPEVTHSVAAKIPDPGQVPNTQALGQILYTRYVYVFQAAGIVLLIAMVGAIVLTLRERAGVRRQNIAEQVSRRPKDTVEVRKVPSRTGI